MRVWDADPAMLCNKHLNAQHREVHWAVGLIEGGWDSHWQDVYRFKDHPKGVQWLGVVHDMTVLELQRRGRYKTHSTLGPTLLPEYDRLVTLWYEHDFWSSWLDRLMLEGYPPTQLKQGTPWERDGVSFEWYREHENDWTRESARIENRRSYYGKSVIE
jgi:Pyrimidine dimer DNA glycosylase